MKSFYPIVTYTIYTEPVSSLRLPPTQPDSLKARDESRALTFIFAGFLRAWGRAFWPRSTPFYIQDASFTWYTHWKSLGKFPVKIKQKFQIPNPSFPNFTLRRYSQMVFKFQECFLFFTQSDLKSLHFASGIEIRTLKEGQTLLPKCSFRKYICQN